MRPNSLDRHSMTGSLWLCCLSVFVGCQANAPVPPPPSFKGFAETGAIPLRFNPASQGDRIRGVDDASIAYLRWCDDVGHQENGHMALVIWTDLDNQNSFANGSQPKSEGAVGEFEFRLGQKDELVMKCQTADGKVGSVSVNGEQFELSRSWLILVSTSNGKVRTKQLQREGIKLSPKHEGGLKEYEALRRDPDLAAFFAKK